MTLFDFLDDCPTSFQAVTHIKKLLKKEGFKEMGKVLEAGGRYFYVHNRTSIAAFILPEEEIEEMTIGVAHSDSPSFKLKPDPVLVQQEMTFLRAECYGGPLVNSWLNRELGIAGEVHYLDEEGEPASKEVVLTDWPVVIPQLAIHLDREIKEKGLKLNYEDHLLALASLSEHEECLEEMLKKKIAMKELLSHDLFLYPLDKAAYAGEKKELISSYRIDNMAGTANCVEALIKQKASKNKLKMIFIWDHEEIGSTTAGGAASPFAEQLLELLIDRRDWLSVFSKSLLVSIDVTHAFHPAYSEKFDANNTPLLGEGPTLKYSARHSYATTAATAALVKATALKKEIPIQEFAGRADMPSGSTVGPLHAEKLGIPVVDIGIPLLSMHAAKELIAAADQEAMTKLLSALMA